MNRFEVALVLLLVPFACCENVAAAAVGIRGKDIFVDNRRFFIKGINYGPWRPGTGPSKGYAYPSPALIESDLKLIRELHANTIFVTDPPDYVLDLAKKYDLKVIYGFYVDWWTIGSNQQAVQKIQQRVTHLRNKSALLGWSLGNEVPPAVIEQRGQKTIENGLKQLYLAVKAVDGTHFVTHSNWPVTKYLDFHFLDVISFNVYPLWPPEVVALGFGNYIEKVLQPIAGGKPLLMSEFGANSLEAGEEGQARLILDSWTGLRTAKTCGAVVFEFADEWWKNYDNPKHVGDWWNRQAAPDDEEQHDQDPEEYYGIVRADRTPKPAFSTVREMFRAQDERSIVSGRILPLAAVSILMLLSLGAFFWGRKRTSSS